MMRLFIFFLISLLGLAAPPDFSGVWRLDVEKSQFDRQAPPRVAVDRIEHHGPILSCTPFAPLVTPSRHPARPGTEGGIPY